MGSDTIGDLVKRISDILKQTRSMLKSNIGFYTIMVTTLVFWIAFLIPDVIGLFKLEKLRAVIEPLIGAGVVLFSVVFVVLLVLRLNDWLSGRREEGTRKSYAARMFDDVSNAELLYLAQYLRHQSIQIAFDDADPIAGSLMDKGLIFPEASPDPTPSFNVQRGLGQTFRISPLAYQYLSDHPQLVKERAQQPKSD